MCEIITLPGHGHLPHPEEYRTLRMRTKLLRTLALAALIPLAACGDDPLEAAVRAGAAAAAPLPRSLEAIGLRGLSWERASLDVDRITLTNVTASLDGVGDVRAAEMVVDGYRGGDAGWDAVTVRAERVVGAARADRITVSAPRAVRDGKAWTVTYSSRSLDGYEGPIMGVASSVRRAAVETLSASGGKPAANRIAADGLRVPEGAGQVPATLTGRDWDIALTAFDAPGGRAAVQIDRADSNGTSLRGVLALSGQAGIVARLADLGLAILAPSAWPADVSIVSLDMDATVERPSTLGLPQSPARIAGTLAGSPGPASWHVSANPPTPLPVRDLPRVLADADADARLGLRATGTGLGGSQEAGQVPAPIQR